ncbi:AMP-binding protein [Luteimonas sp. MJ293]|uniref:AMP-binding protein n=1 Tax=Luteimonas sp. MJ146 TaxID=3129240 RepID=UPI0031BA4E1A
MSAVIDDPAREPTRDSIRSDSDPTPLAVGDPARLFALVGGREVGLQEFLDQARAVAALLPEAGHAVNLCEDRYRFLVAFCAVAMRGQTTLMPPSRTPAAIKQARKRYPDSYCIGDDLGCGCGPAEAGHYLRLSDPLPRLEGPVPLIDGDAVVAIGFTSGSTGEPAANAKTWGSFVRSSAQNMAALEDLWPAGDQPQLVATVPPQHMYGMEMSVLLPLLGGAAVHAGRPFFPADIAAALRDLPGNRVLVTTPVHLRTLVESGADLPPLRGIVSATAPMPPELAAAAEARFDTEVRELFGSTETCIFARRRTSREQAWTLLPGVQLQPRPDGTGVHAPQLAEPVVLADLVELHGPDRFSLRGRSADLLEVAGKRASLGELTRQLLAIPGVHDGVVLQLGEEGAGGVRRIAAVVVAPGLDERAILAALRCVVDPVFLPRRLRLVLSLPRNETGKLPRTALLELLASQ